MNRNEAIELLEKYIDFIEEDKKYFFGDWFEDNHVSILPFLNTDWAKKNLPIINQGNAQFGNNDNSQNQFPRP